MNHDPFGSPNKDPFSCDNGHSHSEALPAPVVVCIMVACTIAFVFAARTYAPPKAPRSLDFFDMVQGFLNGEYSYDNPDFVVGKILESESAAEIRQIAKTGADINARTTDNGQTAFALTILLYDTMLTSPDELKDLDSPTPSLERIQMLIDAGVDINLGWDIDENLKDVTPLMHLTYRACNDERFLEPLRIVAQAGPDFSLKNSNDSCAFDYLFTEDCIKSANQNKIIDVLKTSPAFDAKLLEYAQADANTNYVIDACNSQDLSKLKNFLNINSNIQINAKNENGYNALIGLSACTNTKTAEEITALLKNKGIQLNTPNDKDFTPLMTMAAMLSEENTFPAIKALINSGADPSISTPSGLNPLSVATKVLANSSSFPSYLIDSIKYLIQNGGKINSHVNSNANPENDIPIISYLFFYICKSNDLSLLDILKSSNFDPNFNSINQLSALVTLSTPVCSNNIIASNQILDLMIQKGLNIDQKDSEGIPLTAYIVQASCAANDLSLLNRFLKQKPNLKTKDHQDDGIIANALFACPNSYVTAQALQTLAKAGAPVNDSKTSPLIHVAAYSCISDDLELFKTVINLGADIHAKDTDGRTVSEFIESLVEQGKCSRKTADAYLNALAYAPKKKKK